MLTIPHDRLYKFVAISGLSLVLGSASFGYSTYSDRHQEIMRRLEPVTPLDEKERLLTLRKLPYDSENCKAMAKLSGQPDENACLLKGLRRQEARMEEQIEVVLQSQVKLESISRDIESGRSIFRLRLILSLVGILVGGTVSGLGFRSWLKHERAVGVLEALQPNIKKEG